MSDAKLAAVHPVLPSQDVTAAIEYYTKRLGFTLRGQDSPDTPRYAVIERDDVQLHLQWHDPAEWNAVERPSLRIVAAGLDDLFAEYETKNIFQKSTTIRETPWGTREFAFFDGDSNGLTFYADLSAKGEHA